MKGIFKNTLVALTLLATAFQSAANSALAGESSIKVFVNGVEVTGLVNQVFKNCTVRFDDNGDLYVDAPGYKVKRIDSGETAASSSSSATVTPGVKKEIPGKKYFLVTEENNGSKVWDRYSLILNGSVIKAFKSSDGAVMEDITKHVIRGSNQVVITASKMEEYPGGSKSSWYRIIIGEGHEEGSKIIIDKTLRAFTRKGSDTDPDSISFTLEAK